MTVRVEYLVPGILFPEEYYKTLESWDFAKAVQIAPIEAFCFTMYEVETPPDLGPDFKVIPVAKNKSPRHYLGGTLYTVRELKAMLERGEVDRILVANIESNGYRRAIKCRTGNWQPFEDNDVLEVVD